MTTIPLDAGSPCLALHLLIELINTTGGSLSSRLASEEDIELIFLCPNLPAAIRLDGSGRRLEIGDTLHVSWKLHINDAGPLSPDVLTRFKKGAP